MKDFNTFEFMTTEENEVLLLLYARITEPLNPTVKLDYENHKIILHRNDEDEVMLENIENSVFNDLQDEVGLLVCELSPTENDEETEVIYAYEADIID